LPDQPPTTVFVFSELTSGAMFGAPIFSFLAVRTGDRSLVLGLPPLVSVLPIVLIALMAWGILVG
jgi:hypothetical protein